MSRTTLPLLVACSSLALLGACKDRAAKTPDARPAPAQDAAPALIADAAPTAAAPAPAALVWIEDDAASARSAAAAKSALLFIDFWAPWCHTCLSMKSYVFTDAAFLRKLDTENARDAFVWLAVDTEKTDAAPLLAELPVTTWPTFYVLAPDGETVLGRWVGAATPDQLWNFLSDARATFERRKTPPDGGALVETPADLLREAHLAAVAGRPADAVRGFTEALESELDATQRAAATLGLVENLYRSEQWAPCVERATALVASVPPSPARTDVASFGQTCAGELPANDPSKKAMATAIAAALGPLVDDAMAPLSADDRGDAWGILLGAYELLGDSAKIAAAAAARLAFLEQAMATAPTPVAASTFAWARADTLLTLGRGSEALVFLAALEKDLPKDYNTPHYQARVLLSLGRTDEALAAIDRAIALAYGPRLARLHGVRADILSKAKRPADACKAIRTQGATMATLPEAQLSKSLKKDYLAKVKTFCSAEDVTDVGKLSK